MPYKDPEKDKERKRLYHLKNKEIVRNRSRVRKLEARVLVSLLKESKPCADCNKFWPYYVMQYDHKDHKNKEFEISKWFTHSLNRDKLFKEIEKCDLVCANCHAIRSYLRMTENL